MLLQEKDITHLITSIGARMKLVVKKKNIEALEVS